MMARAVAGRAPLLETERLLRELRRARREIERGCSVRFNVRWHSTASTVSSLNEEYELFHGFEKAMRVVERFAKREHVRAQKGTKR